MSLAVTDGVGGCLEALEAAIIDSYNKGLYSLRLCSSGQLRKGFARNIELAVGGPLQAAHESPAASASITSRLPAKDATRCSAVMCSARSASRRDRYMMPSAWSCCCIPPARTTLQEPDPSENPSTR